MKEESGDEDEKRSPALHEVHEDLLLKGVDVQPSHLNEMPRDNQEDRQASKRVDRDEARQCVAAGSCRKSPVRRVRRRILCTSWR